jgi:hypothetical protein
MVDVETAAWKTVLMYAESGVEDDIDEDGDFTEDEHRAVVARAMDIIHELREQHTDGVR